MKDLGARLRAYRARLNLSLKDVSDKTGITNSRLCKIEQGKLKCHAEDLQSLANIYNIPIVSLYLDAGFLEPRDLDDYKKVFQGVANLDIEEFEHVQAEIDFLNRKKGISL